MIYLNLYNYCLYSCIFEVKKKKLLLWWDCNKELNMSFWKIVGWYKNKKEPPQNKTEDMTIRSILKWKEGGDDGY